MSALGFQLQDCSKRAPVRAGILESQRLRTPQSFSLSPSPSPCSPLRLATEGHPCLDDACSGKKKVYGCALGTVTFYSLKFPWKLRASGFSAPAHPSRKTGLPPSSVCSGVLKQPARDLGRADRRLFGPASRRTPFGSGTSGG